MESGATAKTALEWAKKNIIMDLSSYTGDEDSSLQWDSDWDFLSETGGSDGPSRIIVLVRHGDYLIKEKESAHKKLTELGRAQAAATGRELRKLLEHGNGRWRFDRLIHSSQVRAKETAQIILQELEANAVAEVVEEPLLVEGYPCWPSPPGGDRHIEREVWEVGSRVRAAFYRYFSRPKPEAAKGNRPTVDLIVGHANITRYLLLRALQLPTEAWLRLALPHCSISIVSIPTSGDVKALQIGGIAHVPPSQKSF